MLGSEPRASWPACAAAVSLAACASNSEGAPTSGGSAYEYVEQAKRITKDAETGLVYSATNSFSDSG